jgi:hypothetical protein
MNVLIYYEEVIKKSKKGMAFKPSRARLTYGRGNFWISELTYALSTTNTL